MGCMSRLTRFLRALREKGTCCCKIELTGRNTSQWNGNEQEEAKQHDKSANERMVACSEQDELGVLDGSDRGVCAWVPVAFL
ncbi:hypothetical protein BS78_01G488800 [Paspalum vaginatum]|nr:hypothetical protein BS78_01G488800 [Paspalum vaginatum]